MKINIPWLKAQPDAIFFGKDFFEILIFSLMPDLTPFAIPLTPTRIPCLKLYAFLSRDFLFAYVLLFRFQLLCVSSLQIINSGPERFSLV